MPSLLVYDCDKGTCGKQISRCSLGYNVTQLRGHPRCYKNEHRILIAGASCVLIKAPNVALATTAIQAFRNQQLLLPVVAVVRIHNFKDQTLTPSQLCIDQFFDKSLITNGLHLYDAILSAVDIMKKSHLGA